MRRALECAVLLGALICVVPASAQQPVRQQGTITPGHTTRWITTGVIGDGGSAAQGLLTGLGVTASGPSICANSGPITGPFNRMCLGATQTGGGVLSVDNVGGGTGGFTIKLNGVTQGIATVTLPVTTNDSVCFADTTGTLKDCGGAPIIVSCSTAGAFPVWTSALWGCSTVNGADNSAQIIATNPNIRVADPTFGGALNPVGFGATVTFNSGSSVLGHGIVGYTVLTPTAPTSGSSIGVEGGVYNQRAGVDIAGVAGVVTNAATVATSVGTGVWGIMQGRALGSNSLDGVRATSEVNAGDHPRTYFYGASAVVTDSPKVGMYLQNAVTSGVQIGGPIDSSGSQGLGFVNPTYAFTYYDSETVYASPLFSVDGSANVIGTKFTSIAAATSAKIVGQRANTSLLSPSAVQSGDVITELRTKGYGTSAYGSEISYISVAADGNFSNTSQPTVINFYTVPSGSVTATIAMQILSNQHISLAQPLELSSGGTGANLTGVNGGIVYSGASTFAISAAGTSGQALLSGGAGAPTWATIRTVLSTTKTFFVNFALGTDSATCGQASGASACKNMQAAYDNFVSGYDCNGYTVTISVADSVSYTAGLSITRGWTGGCALSVTGNGTTPANVTVTTTSASSGLLYVATPLPGTLTITGFKIISTNFHPIYNAAAGVIVFNNINFGAAVGWYHVYASGNGAQIIAANAFTYTISGGAAYHLVAASGGQIVASSGTATLTGTFNIGTYVWATRVGSIQASGVTYTTGAWTISGTVKRWASDLNGVIDTGGACTATTPFPGNSNGGPLVTGGQCS